MSSFRSRAALALFLSLAALSTSACMTGPNYGDRVDSYDAVLTFTGFTTGAGEQVQVLAAPSPSGPFEVVATVWATSSKTGTWDGYDLYSWSVKSLVPRHLWSISGADRQTFVKAHGVSTNFDFYSFDNKAIKGQDWWSCLSAEDAKDNHNGPQSMNACKSQNSPVARVAAACKEADCPCTSFGTVSNDVTVSTSSDLAALRCVSTITGSLTVNGPTADLGDVPLPSLTTVGGNVTLAYAPLTSAPTQMRTIGLPALTKVGGSLALQISRFPEGGSLDVNMNALSSVGGVSVMAMTDTVSIAGLHGLHAAPSVSMAFDGDVTIADFLPSLSNVDGNVVVQNTRALHGALRGLTTVKGDFSLAYSGSASLPPDDVGFSALQTVGGGFTLNNTPWSQFGGAAPAFAQLGRVGGVLSVLGTRLASVAPIGGSALQVGSVDIEGNGALTALNPTRIAVTSTGDITISANPTLPQCEVDAFVAAQGSGWTGNLTADGDNGAGTCNTPEALTVTKSGNGKVSGGPIACGDKCTASFAPGATVTLTAAPDPGWTFAGWSGACSGTGACALTMDASKNVVATFNPPAPPKTYTLTLVVIDTTVQYSPTNGVLTASFAPTGSPMTCTADPKLERTTCTTVVPAGTVVSVANNGSASNHFDGYGGACSGAGACGFTMNGDVTVTGSFSYYIL